MVKARTMTHRNHCPQSESHGFYLGGCFLIARHYVALVPYRTFDLSQYKLFTFMPEFDLR